MDILFIIIGLLVGAALAYLFVRGKLSATETKLSLLEDDERQKDEQLRAQTESLRALQEERTGLLSRRDVLTAQVEDLRQDLEKLSHDKAEMKSELTTGHEQQVQELKNGHEQRLSAIRQDYEQRLDEQKAQYEQMLQTLRNDQKEQLDRQSSLIREQINAASEEILKKRSEELSSTNKEQLATILTPLQEHLKQMKEAVERSDREQSTVMERLDASIKENLKQAEAVGMRADKLAQALTSENKTQGNFGELRLRTLLENMGLEEGTQFEEQVTMRDEHGRAIREEEGGHRMIPDVILHFPDERDIIIDSKMSLKAFEDYFNAETDEQKAEALQRHVMSVRNHVKELGHKNYSSYLKAGHRKLDFVVMYIYSESALQLALTSDPALWKDAYEQGVVISGSQNLYMMLRVLEMTWRQVRQAENQEEIMKAANTIVDRVQLFYERLLGVEEQFKKTTTAFEGLRRTTAPSGQSITVAAARLLKYGAQENPKRKQHLPKPTDEQAIEDLSNDNTAIEKAPGNE